MLIIYFYVKYVRMKGVFFSVFLVIWSVRIILWENIVLRSQHVELRVLEPLVGVLYLSQPIFHRFLLVSLLLEDGSLSLEFPLQLSWLGVQPVVHEHLFSKGAVLPEADRACTDKGGALEHPNLLVHVDFASNVSQADLPHLECHWDDEEGRGLVGVFFECGILAEVLILQGVI